MQPPIPPLNSLRLATPSDVNRIGIAVVSSFSSSPTFRWYRCYHSSYPSDTLSTYRKIFADFIKSPKHIVLVALDKYKPDESTKSSAIILKEEIYDEFKEGEEVIVGIAVWALEEGSRRVGQFQGGIETFPEVPVTGDRDVHKEHDKLVCEEHAATHHKYFQSCSELEMLAVHPAYWGNGHGSTLVKWGLELAKIDGVKMGVMGPDMGVRLYKSLGFKHLTGFQLDGDEVVPEGLKFGVLRFEP